MCEWCEGKERATYNIPVRGNYSMVIENSRIIAYHYIGDSDRADMALTLNIDYCPMCGERLWDDDEDEEEEEY